LNANFRNPILSGCYPDPSICRAGDDFYLVTSTFEYFPGLPIFHSRDLVHWRQIGHALTRESQLPLHGVRSSGGLYAPTIRYANGLFYIINTLVDGLSQSGNFIVTASDPAGPWSEPYWLDGADGIDPSLFFDADGRTWYVGSRMATQSRFEGHTEIWLQELDLQAMRLIGEPLVLWDGALKDATWAEAPHIYKVGDTYYLLIAEGGTAQHHAVTVARSKNVGGPYEANPGNPILTHRHLGLDYPIVGIGHADLVDTPSGEWWAVLLGMRPYGGYYYNLGRETFLVPVRWEQGWPVFSPGAGKVEFAYPVPNLPPRPWPQPPACDDFDSDSLAFAWNALRASPERFASLSERPGFLRLRLQPERLAENASPSFIGRRQQHIHFYAQAEFEFHPSAHNECAGLALTQSPDFHYLFVVTLQNEPVLQLIKRASGIEEILASCPISTPRIRLKVEAHDQDYCFYYADEAGNWRALLEGIDGRILSTPVAGGFLGAYLGMYASSNGQPSSNQADFDWFEYAELLKS
jgi:alpha-N-arabinofuranosidase